jgi:hypothetical protein
MKRQTDITLLLIVLILLSASIGVLHGRRNTVEPTVTAHETQQIIDYQDAIDYVQPYLISGNVDLVATAIAQIYGPLFEKVLQAIVDDETIRLSDEQKVQLLAAILLQNTSTANQQMVLENMVRYFPQYALFTPLAPRYSSAISLITTLAHNAHRVEQLNQWADRSIDMAIEQDDIDLLKGLAAAGIEITPAKASALLYRVASENKKAAFVPLLVEQFKADSNYTPDNRHTPLIKAVQQNNRNMAKALLKQGAQAEQVLDPAVGSARQIAFEQGHIPIELILKNIGD